MGATAEPGGCRWCGRPLAGRAGPGRPRAYCRPSCRQRAYEARRLASQHGLPAGLVAVSGAELQALRDRLYELETAVADAAGDLADAQSLIDARAALAVLRGALSGARR